MNSEIGGIIRTILAGGFAYAAGKGWLPVGDYQELAGTLSVAFVGVWSIFSKRKTA